MMIDSCASTIESIFFDYLSKKIGDRELCRRISQALSAANLNGMHKDFEVSIIDGRSEFVGLCVYPDMQQYAEVFKKAELPRNDIKSAYDQICTEWSTSIKRYYIEIDKNMLDRKVINFNPPELTAMLLHELAHVVYSDRTVEKIYRAYRMHQSEMRKHDPGLRRVAINTLYIIPGIIACAAHKANTGRNGMNEEYICDKVFGLKGYQQHLVSALDKIIKAYGTKFVLDDGTADKKIDATMRWVDFNVDNMISRRDALGREIVNMASGTRSKYTKDILLDITKKLGIGARDKYTGSLIAMESIFDGIYDGKIDTNGFFTKYDFIDDYKAIGLLEMTTKMAPATEGFSKPTTPKLPSAFDIDSISIEIDRVRTHADRLYVLDLIHTRLEQIAEFEEYYGNNKYTMSKFQPKIDRYKENLDQMRNLLLSKHNLEKTYKVFTKCPVGYEG